MVEGIQTRAPSKTMSFGDTNRQKFQYLTCKETDEFKKFENVTPAIQNDQDGMACNGKFTAVNWATTSSVAVFPSYEYKRFDQTTPLIKGHSAQVTDMQWCPFQERLLATSSDDASIKLWVIENDKGISEHMADSAMSLEEHTKKCKAV